ncbi:MAG: hypothetical protein KAT30_08075, partial [Candidatus Krumholzibacteria bacterium]|nr:hypothetical protein [Candidatus Krumholzibacteria bacterium]
DFQMFVSGESAGFPWDYGSGSIDDRTRLMLDLFAGRKKYGELYLKAAALWSAPRTDNNEIEVEFEQGDYLWSNNSPRLDFDLRLYANERRYFTGDLSGSILDDDLVSLHQNHYGLRHDGTAGDFLWSAQGAVLGDTWDQSRKLYHLRAGWLGSVVQLSASYLNSAPAVDSLDNHAVIKGELSAVYKRAGLVAAYALSGFDDSAIFLPSANGDGSVGAWPDNEHGLAPQAGAVFLEARLSKIPLGKSGLWSFVGRYDAAGDEFLNDLGTLRRGETIGKAAVYYAASKVCVNGALVYTYYRRTRFDDKKRNQLEARVQGLLANGGQFVLRSAWAETDDELGIKTQNEFIHAALKRHGKKIYSALHLMTVDFSGSGPPRDDRLGVETRFNFTASVALYGRLIMSQRVTSRDAVYWRFELRPTENVFVSFGYGRSWVGDDPFLLEDTDIGQRNGVEPVYFVTVRG